MSAAGPAVPLHRVRFVDWTPSSITALAFSPVPPRADGAAHVSASARSLLAIGRENGNIDLCTWCEGVADGAHGELAKGWIVERTLLGDVNYKIEALVFALGAAPGRPDVLRLFSTSGGTIVTEHFLPPGLARVADVHTWTRASDADLVHDAPTRTLSSHGGAVWSIAASPLGRFLAIGCEDGVVRLIDIADGNFEHAGATQVPRLARAGSRIMSLAWGPPRRVGPSATSSHNDDDDSDNDDEWAESFVFGGLGNSAAAVWNVGTGHIQTRLSVLKNRSEHTIVWAVAVLGDGTLVTGDSTGRVTFFDARSRVPIPGATFQCHTSGADVLALCVGPDGRAVYSAGVDQKVAEYTHIAQQWVHTGTRRLHAHDIRALAVDPPFDMVRAAREREHGALHVPRLPVLVSGGIDFNVVMTPAAPAAQYHWQKSEGGNPISSSDATAFADTTQRRIPFVPQSSRTGVAGGGVVAVCPARRWLVLRRDTSIGIWHVGDAWCKVAELELRVRSNLACVAASADGRFLAASDMYETKVFELDERDGLLAPRRVDLGAVGAPGASALAFTPDGRRLVLCTLHGTFVHVLQLFSGSPAQLLRTFAQHRVRATDAPDGRARAGDARIHGKSADAREVYAPVVLAAVSPDGQWLFTADSVRRMHTFNLDSLTHTRALPSPASVPASVCFHPQRPSVLAVAMPTNDVYFYDLDAEGGGGDAAADAERTLHPELERVIGRFREPLVGSSWLARGADSVLVLCGPTWLCTARATGLGAAPKKRGGASDEPRGAWVVRATTKYQPLLYAGVLGDSLVAVERPYVALAQGLPPAFYRGAKYGF